jgi:shikimate kinase
MAAGKSSVVQAMSRSRGLPGVDLDELVSTRAGQSLPEIFGHGGVARFRREESQALAELPAKQPLLIATGGGIVEEKANRDLLTQHGVVIWLDAPWEILRYRIEAMGSARRPLVQHLGWRGLQQLYHRRARLYAAVAHFRLRTDRFDVGGVSRQALLRSLLWRRRQQVG